MSYNRCVPQSPKHSENRDHALSLLMPLLHSQCSAQHTTGTRVLWPQTAAWTSVSKTAHNDRLIAKKETWYQVINLFNIHWWHSLCQSVLCWAHDWLIRKDSDAGKDRAGGEVDDRGWDGGMASPARWTWVWGSSGSWWRTGKPGVLQSMRSQSQTWLSHWTNAEHKR